MNQALATTARWTVSVRADGEVLTAGAGSDGLEFTVAGFPDRFTPDEIAGWLNDLTGVARETALGDSSARTIPPLLHHALTGLLFSHAELWESDGVTRPCSSAFVITEERVAFGWVGEVLPEVWVDEGPLEEVYTRVRDDEGREALGIAFDPRHRVRVRLTWSALPGATDAPSSVIEAEWPGLSTAFEDALAMDTVAVAALAARATEPEAVAPASRLAAADAFEPSTRPIEPPESPPIEWSASDATVAEEVSPAPAKPSFFGRITSWLRRTKPAEDRVAEPRPVADETSVPEPAPEPEPSPEEHALALSLEESLALADTAEAAETHTASSMHEAMYPQTPAPPALVRADASVGDPHERMLGDAPAPARPVLHVPAPADPVPAGPPVLRVTHLEDERAIAPPPAVAPAPRAREDRASIPPLPPAAAAPPVAPAVSGPLEVVRGLDPEPAEALAPPAIPAWEPPPSIIVDPTVATSEESALAAALAALAADAPASEAPVHTPPATPPGPAALGTSDAMRAALGARAAARPAVAPAPPVPAAAPVPVAPVAAAPARAAAPVAPVAPSERVAPAPAEPVTAERRSAMPAERPPLRPDWPSAEQLTTPVPLWKKPWAWGIAVAVLFLAGWLLGGLQHDRGRAARPGPLTALARGLGIGGARFDVMVNSRPPGAWIAVDGKDLARRTPATIDLPPGEHTVTLSMSDLGSASFPVRGERGDQVALDAPLWGTLDVYAADGSPPVTVTFDGRTIGFAPVRLDSVMPGAHDLRFSGPGMTAWGQPVEVRVGQQAEVVARPMTSPATGMIEVRARITDDEGTRALSGAQVFVDGESRGATPLTLELPRGPHSVRVTYRGESAPVQVIDLPGGNQRFADFDLGGGADGPRLLPVDVPARFNLARPGVVSAGLDGVSATDVREMWLHVRTPEGAWKRYQMALLKAPGGVTGVVVFPANLFAPGARARWYASATVTTGDEYFTEIANTEIAGAPAR